MKTKCLVYLRSTEYGPERDVQLRDINKYAKKNNFEIVKIFEDENSLDDLVALKELTQQLSSTNTLVVWSLDRLGPISSSTTEVIQFLSNVVRNGLRFISVTNNLDSFSTGSQFIMQLSESIKSAKVALKGERVHLALKTAKELGEPVGRPKERNDDKIRGLRREGLSIREIAQSLGTSTRSVSRSLANLD